MLAGFTREDYISYALSEFGWTTRRASREWRRMFNDPTLAREEDENGETIIWIRVEFVNN